MKILIPLDLSAQSETAIATVQRIFPKGSEILLLHVVPPLPISLSGASVMGDMEVERERETGLHTAGPYLEEMASSLRKAGFVVATSITEAEPVEGIAAAATTFGADLIAMATHGRSGISHFLMGSVAEGVIRGTLIPVLCIREAH